MSNDEVEEVRLRTQCLLITTRTKFNIAVTYLRAVCRTFRACIPITTDTATTATDRNRR